MKHKLIAAITLILASVTAVADDLPPIFEAARQCDGVRFSELLKQDMSPLNKTVGNVLHLGFDDYKIDSHGNAMRDNDGNRVPDTRAPFRDYTLLAFAAESDCTNIIQQLLDVGADVKKKSVLSKYSPICLASGNGHIEAVKMLLEAKAEPDDGIVAACENGHADVLKVLIDGRANGIQETYAGKNMLLGAVDKGNLNVVQQLLNLKVYQENIGAGARSKAFRKALVKGDLEIVKAFVSKGEDLSDARDDFDRLHDERTLVQIAREANKPEIVTYLIEEKAALQKENAEKLAVTESQKVTASDAHVQTTEEQKQFAWVFLIAGLAAIVTVIWCVIKAVRLSLNEEAVVFWGRRDLTASIIFSVMTLISFITLMVTLTTDVLDREWWPFILFSLITAFLLAVSIKRSFAANLRNRKKTFIVVVAKLVFSFLAVFCFLITYLSISNTLSNKDSEGRRKSAGDFARDAMMMGFLMWCSKWAATGLFFLVKKNSLEDTVGGEPSSSDHNESREAQSDSTANISHCYHVLELKSGASLDQVKKAWRDLVMVWHPDRFPNNESLQRKAGERLKEINAAYEMLKQHLGSSEAAPA